MAALMRSVMARLKMDLSDLGRLCSIVGLASPEVCISLKSSREHKSEYDIVTAR